MALPDNLNKKQAIYLLWQRGVLSYRLDATQKELYQSYLDLKHKTAVWTCSRRLGKSFTLCIVAVEMCLKKPGAIVKFIAPTQKHVKMIIRPLLKEIFQDCPKELKPHFRTNDNVYRFSNGSEIQLAGTDSGHAEGLRGGSADLCLVDEAGFCDDLRYIVQSILIPTTTTTNGKIILSSTPPVSPDHEFCKYQEEADFRGTHVMKTIYDNPRLSKEQIQEIVNEYGGEGNPDFRREYLCEKLVDDKYAVVPEFTPDIQAQIIQEWKTPSHRDLYVAGDIGFKDLTVFLFAYYDFKEAKVVIEDEVVMSGQQMTTAYMAEQVKLKEKTLWQDPISKEQLTPYLRVCDNNLIVINDLQKLHQLTFVPTRKDDADAARNNLRMMIRNGQIIINPRCKTLIHHLKNATWNKSRSSYTRSPDAGHYDAVDAASYLIRNVQMTKNPYPSGYGRTVGDAWYEPRNNQPVSPAFQALDKMFTTKKSLKRRGLR